MNYAMSTNLTGECMRRATIPCDTLQNYRFFILTSFIFNLPMQAAYFYLLLPVGILSFISLSLFKSVVIFSVKDLYLPDYSIQLKCQKQIPYIFFENLYLA